LDYLRLDQRVVVRVYSPSEPVRVEVKSEGHGNILAQQTLKQLRHGWGEAEFDVASLPLGRYRVQAGGAQARFEKDTNATWTDAAKLGKLDGVLPPWTPLQRPDEHTIVVWGRRIVLDENQLPRSIRCLGTELLAAPVQLRGGPAKVSLCADYDGFLKFDVEVLPSGTTRELPPLTLVIPLQAKYAKYLAFSNSVRAEEQETCGPSLTYAGAVFDQGQTRESVSAPWPGVRIDPDALRSAPTIATQDYRAVPFIPHFWIGDERVGLVWCCESAKWWEPINNPRAIEWVRHNEVLEARVHFISKTGVIASQARRFTFALQPTPVRPPMSGWRDLRMEMLHKAERYNTPRPEWNVAYYYVTCWSPNVGLWYPVPRDPQRFKEVVADYRRQGFRIVLPYTNPTTAVASPEMQAYGAECAKVPVNVGSYGGAARVYALPPYTEYKWWCPIPTPEGPDSLPEDRASVPYMITCPRSRWQDFYIWGIEHMITHYGITGVYMDLAEPVPCMNAAHGCGWLDEAGVRHPEWPIFAYRELIRRVRSLFVVHGIPPYICIHTNMRRVPAYSFADTIKTGEQFERQGKDKGIAYLKDIPLDYVQACLTGAQTGHPNLFIPELHRNQTREASEQFFALGMLHDCIVWGDAVDREVMYEIWKAQRRFGVGDAEFVGSWDPALPIQAQPDVVKVSLWKKQKNIMAVVVNFQDRPVIVCLLPKSGSALPVKMVDAMTGKVIGEQCEVRPLNFRLVLFRLPQR